MAGGGGGGELLSVQGGGAGRPALPVGACHSSKRFTFS